MTQAQFDRLTGATRDDWRKWSRRELVDRSPGGYGWRQVAEALALRAMEAAIGTEGVVHCWGDVHDELLRHIRQDTLDLVVDPGVSTASRPRMRAFLSTSDTRTASLARAAEHPHVLPLADLIRTVREEYERTIRRAQAHADKKGTASDESQDTAGRRRG